LLNPDNPFNPINRGSDILVQTIIPFSNYLPG
jgi:hypothetical protein